MAPKTKYLLVGFLLLVLGFLYFWFVHRPADVKKGCDNTARLERYNYNMTHSQVPEVTANEIYDHAYEECLHRFGL
jgi:hypothetical protein